jgi:hypothetical protein
MATTTNYSWTTPDDTALVKDGAAAIRSLGTAIDTTVFNNAGAAIAKTIVDAKGDLIVATAADTVARLASSGVNGEVLQVDTSTATGLKYAAVAAGSNWSLLNSGGTALTGAQTITVSGISGKDKIMILFDAASSASASSYIGIRLNTDTGSNYTARGTIITLKANYSDDPFSKINMDAQDVIRMARMSSNASSDCEGYLLLSGCNSSGVKMFNGVGAAGSAQNGKEYYFTGGFYNSASTISSISMISSTGNFDTGTVYVYTSA